MNQLFRTVSICIPTYNRQELLTRCIRSVLAQNYPKEFIEVIVANDCSTDDTTGIVDEIKMTSLVPIKLVQNEKNSGPGATRNLAIRNATGELVAFIDDDVTTDPDWLKAAVSRFNIDCIGAVEGKTIVADKQNMSPFTHCTFNLTGGYYPTCNMVYRRALLDEVGGFDELFYDSRIKLHFREDSDLAFRVMKKGYEIVFEPEAIVYHPPLHASFSRPLISAKRHYFDPLLYRRHPDMFLLIDNSKIGPFKTRRFVHYSNMAFLMLFAAAVALLPFSPVASAAAAAALAVVFIAIFYRNCRGSRLKLLELPQALAVFFMVPLVYGYYLTLGMIRFREFRVIF